MAAKLCAVCWSWPAILLCLLLCLQIGQMFKPEHPDTEYERGSYMLKGLGLQASAQSHRRITPPPAATSCHQPQPVLPCSSTHPAWHPPLPAVAGMRHPHASASA